jgi:hypothetical protein
MEVMDTTGYVEIRISGQKGGIPLTPENFDISEIRELLSNFESIAFPGGKRNRPIVAYEQLNGSVIGRFKTKAQAVLAVAAILGPIKANPGLEFLELETARGIEARQTFAHSRDYNIEIRTSVEPDEQLTINRDTSYHLNADALVAADFYLYGEVSTIGGKTNPSVRIDTSEYGMLVLKTSREELQKIEQNVVYSVIGVHAKGKQSARDYEIDRQSLELVSFLEYAPKPDREYLNSLIKRASKSWDTVADPDAWLRELRGGRLAD